MWRTYKTYAVVVFLVYICAVAIFHFQLHKNLGLKYAAFQEASDRKLDKALKKIEVLNRRIQDLSRIPVYHFQQAPMTRRRSSRYENLRSLYWQTRYDYSRPVMAHCHHQITHSFSSLGQMFVYSAHYDDRNQTEKFIRIMALLPLRYKVPVHCQFRHANSTLVSPLTYYEMCENHARRFGGYVLSCPVPPALTSVPCQVKVVSNVSLSDDVHLQRNSVTVPVLASNQLSNVTRKRFAVCIPPLFGVIKQRLLVDFIELNLLLGVQHFNFYTFQVSAGVQKILDHYESMGVVTQIHWTLPITSGKVWYNGQLLTINDCLYRNMYHFDYIGFHDIDEVMVPHGQYHTWPQLLRDLRRKDDNDTVAGYVFPSAFFDITNRSEVGKVPRPYFTEETQRNLVISQVRTKCLVRPSRIFELGIHHISRTFLPSADVIRLKEEQGYLHHYRKCVTEFDPRMRCGPQTTDHRLKSLSSVLKIRSQEAMETIFKRMANSID